MRSCSMLRAPPGSRFARACGSSWAIRSAWAVSRSRRAWSSAPTAPTVSPRARYGLGNGIVRGVALEGNVAYGRVAHRRYARRAVIELADIPGGYGWVFPKGDHVNVGVGAWEREGPRLRDHLRRVCEVHGLAVEELANVRGHRLPLRKASTRTASERALLVGDAAGLIDPVSGDGMYECFVSARLASLAIVELLSGRASSLAALLCGARQCALAPAPCLLDVEEGPRSLAPFELGARPHATRLDVGREAPACGARRAPRAARHRARSAARARVARPALGTACRHAGRCPARPRGGRSLVRHLDVRELDG